STAGRFRGRPTPEWRRLRHRCGRVPAMRAVAFGVIAVTLLPQAVPASTVVVDDATPGFYNAAIGTVLAAPQQQFPLANTAGGDPKIVPAPEPDLTAAAAALGDWLAPDPFPLDSNWTGPQAIPPSWAVNTETAIVYVVDAGPDGLVNL